MRMRKFNQTAVPNFLTEEFAQKRKVQSEPMVLTSLFFSKRITVPAPVTLKSSRYIKSDGVETSIITNFTIDRNTGMSWDDKLFFE